MTRDEILALRPASGDAASYRAALVKASELLGQQRKLATEREAFRRASVLTADDRALTTAEKDAAAARLAVDRIEALLPSIRADADAAEGRETVQQLRDAAREVADRVARYEAWLSDVYPKIMEMIAAGYEAEDSARIAYARFVVDVNAAYRSQHVRDVGPLNVTLATPSAGSARASFPPR